MSCNSTCLLSDNCIFWLFKQDFGTILLFEYTDTFVWVNIEALK